MSSGGFPLLTIARAYGVDYGDMLLWSDYLRHDHQRVPMSAGRLKVVDDALYRIIKIIGPAAQIDLLHAVVRHVAARWVQGGHQQEANHG